VATFRGKRAEAVVAWSPEGDALVVDAEQGRLVPARTRPGFTGLKQEEQVIAAVPAAPGWQLIQADAATGEPIASPIAVWLINAYGQAMPVSALSSSYLEPDSYGIIHPPGGWPDTSHIKPRPWCGQCDPAGEHNVLARKVQLQNGKTSMCHRCHPELVGWEIGSPNGAEQDSSG